MGGGSSDVNTHIVSGHTTYFRIGGTKGAVIFGTRVWAGYYAVQHNDRVVRSISEQEFDDTRKVGQIIN